MTKLPPRARSQAEGVDAVDAVVPPPAKLPRTGPDRVDRVGGLVSQGPGRSRLNELSTGDSRGPRDDISSGSSGPSANLVDNSHPASPAEVPMPSCQHNVANDEPVDVQGVVVEKVNPKQGPTTGGPEIWISGSSFPTDLRPLYVRFGSNSARAVGVLSTSFVKYLTASRPFKYLACSRAPCRQPMFQAWFK